ncbi:DUF86 domain-containing protein [Algoriphagus yeomjeoni]|uniref:HepT-like ribonuclease domain-containing protein n=1 Tax=Algoriphagus yeomjeoni TaxID=291403 RepID=UPI003CE48145
MGEASIRIDDDFKLSHPQIEWKKLRGFRNRIVHEYFGIDIEIVWNIIESDIDDLLFQIENLLNKNQKKTTSVKVVFYFLSSFILSQNLSC